MASDKLRRRLLREAAGVAYERELGAALAALEKDFTRWRSGKLSPFELSDRIHAFHDETARELYKTYVMSRNEVLAVASAVHRGVLEEADLPPEIRDEIAAARRYFDVR